MFQEFRADIPATRRTFEIDNLDVNTEYHFQVAAINNIGPGQFSSILAARTLETGKTPLTRVSVVTRRGFLGDTPGILTHYIIP